MSVRSLLGRKRRTGVLGLAGVIAAPLLVGCGGDDGQDRARVETVERHALAAVDGVLHDIATDLELEFGGGNHFFAICGESYAPQGVIHQVITNFSPSALTDVESVARVTTLLDEAGWVVEAFPNPAVVEGTQEDNTLRLEFGPAAVSATVRSDCIETSDGFARDQADVEAADIDWK